MAMTIIGTVMATSIGNTVIGIMIDTDRLRHTDPLAPQDGGAAGAAAQLVTIQPNTPRPGGSAVEQREGEGRGCFVTDDVVCQLLS